MQRRAKKTRRSVNQNKYRIRGQIETGTHRRKESPCQEVLKVRSDCISPFFQKTMKTEILSIKNRKAKHGLILSSSFALPLARHFLAKPRACGRHGGREGLGHFRVRQKKETARKNDISFRTAKLLGIYCNAGKGAERGLRSFEQNFFRTKKTTTGQKRRQKDLLNDEKARSVHFRIEGN